MHHVYIYIYIYIYIYVCVCVCVCVNYSSSVTHCFNAAMVQTTFTTRAAFRSTHKDVLTIFQLRTLIHKFQCCRNAAYIGRNSQRLDVQVKPLVPRDIRNRTTSWHPKLLDSTISEHLNVRKSCVVMRALVSFIELELIIIIIIMSCD